MVGRSLREWPGASGFRREELRMTIEVMKTPRVTVEFPIDGAGRDGVAHPSARRRCGVDRGPCEDAGVEACEMKVVIPGGSGQVGTLLAREFHARGHEVVVLSRKPADAPWRVTAWDAKTQGDWAAELNGADAVINLAGRVVNCRYNAVNRREILDSRVHSTRAVGQAIARAARPPRVWLQASTATIYAHRYDAANDETTGVLGGSEPDAPETWRFSIDVATSWERALDEAECPHTRKVALRSAMTMSPDRGGVFDVLLGLVRRGLGGTSGDGRQYVSWIHDRDFVRAVVWLIAHEEVAGPVNLAAPNPCRTPSSCGSCARRGASASAFPRRARC
jgi:uncharacterized protein (TIGR01777 family)